MRSTSTKMLSMTTTIHSGFLVLPLQIQQTRMRGLRLSKKREATSSLSLSAAASFVQGHKDNHQSWPLSATSDFLCILLVLIYEHRIRWPLRFSHGCCGNVHSRDGHNKLQCQAWRHCIEWLHHCAWCCLLKQVNTAIHSQSDIGDWDINRFMSKSSLFSCVPISMDVGISDFERECPASWLSCQVGQCT